MPVDPTGPTGPDPTRTESDTPMFAPIRTSERGKRTSFFGGEPTTAAEPRSFAESGAGTPMTSERPVDTADTGFAAGPTFADRQPPTRRSSAVPMAIAGGLVLLAGAGAAGWYYSQNEQGVAQLIPGGSPAAEAPVAPPTNELAQAPAAAQTPAATPAPAAPAAAPPATATAKAAPPPRPLRATHARAASRSVEDQGVNASTIAPAPRSPPMPVNPPANPTPPQAAPAPAPTPVTPPPSDTTPAPTQTAPTQPPQQQTPPTPPTQPPPQ